MLIKWNLYLYQYMNICFFVVVLFLSTYFALNTVQEISFATWFALFFLRCKKTDDASVP